MTRWSMPEDFVSGVDWGKSSVRLNPLLPDIQCFGCRSPSTMVSKKSPGP